MQHIIPVHLIDESKAPVVKAQRLTIFLPDDLPDTPTIVIATEAYEERSGYWAKIYREVELPTASVAACFKLEGIKVVVDTNKAAALLAMFNYQTAVQLPPTEPIS